MLILSGSLLDRHECLLSLVVVHWEGVWIWDYINIWLVYSIIHIMSREVYCVKLWLTF